MSEGGRPPHPRASRPRRRRRGRGHDAGCAPGPPSFGSLAARPPRRTCWRRSNVQGEPTRPAGRSREPLHASSIPLPVPARSPASQDDHACHERRDHPREPQSAPVGAERADLRGRLQSRRAYLDLLASHGASLRAAAVLSPRGRARISIVAMAISEHDAPATRLLDDAAPWPTLPGTDYHAADVFDIERERVFVRSWVCVGRAEQLPGGGRLPGGRGRRRVADRAARR